MINSALARHMRRALPTARLIQETCRRSMGSKRGGGGKRQKGKTAKKAATKLPKPPKEFRGKTASTPENAIPPALLAPTGSRHVFVARTALDETIDASNLFANNHSRPRFCSENEFDYLSPTELNYEYPTHKLPEVAFLGRSNVGKSSLINALMRKDLCITSKSPGRTQLPYYYGLFPKFKETKSSADALGFIIDLPGYGYAAAPKAKVEDWQAATQDLLLDRRDVLKRVFLLADTRREGLTEFDLIVIKWLEDAEIPFSVVLTKSDRTSAPSIIKQVNELCIRHSSQQIMREVVALSPVFHVTSSRDNLGINELLQSIEAEFLGEEEYDEEDFDYDA